MASRGIPNVFEITYGGSSTGLLSAGRADTRISDRRRPEIEDDGLGCVRGLAIAMAFNAVLILLAASAWELWKYWR